MGSTVFYERRKGHKQVEFDQRQILRRSNNAKIHTAEQRRLATLVRRYQRGAFKIPVRFQIQGKDFPGYTHDISPEGILVFTEASLNAGTPMTLQFSFGQNVCHLNVSGQVVFCRLAENGESLRHVIGIKFSAIREFEQKILTSTVQELKQSPAMYEKSLLNIHVSTDTLAQEAEGFPIQTPLELVKDKQKASHTSLEVSGWKERIGPTSAAALKGFKRSRKFTAHPPWILELDRYIEPYRQAIWNCRLITKASSGNLSLRQMRARIIQLYPFIETFPQYLAMNIVKAPDLNLT